MEDVDRLRLLARLVESGHGIGRIARLNLRDLRDLDRKHQPHAALTPVSNAGLDTAKRAVLSELERLDLDGVDRELTRLRLVLKPAELALGVFSPLLQEVGAQVEQGRLGIVEEHALSALIRDHLGQILQQARHAHPLSTSVHFAPIVLATREGDLHEFGILISSVLLAARGVPFRYLGPNMPAAELARAAERSGAAAVLLGSVPLPSQTTPQTQKAYLRALDPGLPGDCEVWMGGHLDNPALELESGRLVKHFSSLSALEKHLG
jgi:methanogenic corrinoid protein MtbC1